jgi:hypothetical protein
MHGKPSKQAFLRKLLEAPQLSGLDEVSDCQSLTRFLEKWDLLLPETTSGLM